jgi:hypothetical protein
MNIENEKCYTYEYNGLITVKYGVNIIIENEKREVKIFKQGSLCPVIRILGKENIIYYVQNFVQNESSFTINLFSNKLVVCIDFDDLETEDCINITSFLFYFLFFSSED